MTDALITAMLSELGITDAAAQQSALDALVAAGVVSGRPNRTRIAEDKRERLARSWAMRFFVTAATGIAAGRPRTPPDHARRCWWSSSFARSAAAPPTAARWSAWQPLWRPRGPAACCSRRHQGDGARDTQHTPAFGGVAVRERPDVQDDRYYRADMQWAELHSHLVQHAVASQGVEALWRQRGQPQDDGDASWHRRPCRPGEAAPGAVERTGAD